MPVGCGPPICRHLATVGGLEQTWQVGLGRCRRLEHRYSRRLQGHLEPRGHGAHDLPAGACAEPPQRLGRRGLEGVTRSPAEVVRCGARKARESGRQPIEVVALIVGVGDLERDQPQPKVAANEVESRLADGLSEGIRAHDCDLDPGLHRIDDELTRGGRATGRDEGDPDRRDRLWL